MSMRLVCDACGEEWPERTPRTRCTCGGLMSVLHEPTLRGEASCRIACATSLPPIKSRITLMPPEVEPVHPPTSIATMSSTIAAPGHAW